LFDTSVGLNLGAAKRSNIIAAQSANAQARAAQNAAMMEAGGAVGAAAITAI